MTNTIKVGTVKTGLLSVLLIAAGACTAMAQPAEYPFEGEVTGMDVYVRSEPNLASYPVAKISSPARVTVTAKVAEGWYAIKPVPGCYAVIDQSLVKLEPSAEARPARTEGVITGENARVRAAGTLRRANFDSILMKADKGEKVVIVGTVEEGDSNWYIILPPEKARYFISSQYVQAATGEAPAAPAETAPESEYEAPTPATAPAADAAKPAAATETATPAEAAPAEKVEVKLPENAPAKTAAPVEKPAIKKPVGVRSEGDMLRQIRKLERDLMEESAKPMEQRNMNRLLEEAQAINVPDGSRFKPVFDSMVDYIKGEIRIDKETRRTQELVAKTLENVNAPVKPLPAKPQAPSENVVVGKLQASRVFDRYDSATGQMYTVRNVETGEILTFAKPASSLVNVGAYVGKIVRIGGKKDFDRHSGVQVIKIDRISQVSEEDAVAESATTSEAPAETPATETAATETPAAATPAETPAETPAVKPEPEKPAVAATPEVTKPATPEDVGMAPVEKPNIEEIDIPAPKPEKTTPEPIAVTPIEPTEAPAPETAAPETAVKPELPPVEPITTPAPAAETAVAEKPAAPAEIPAPAVEPEAVEKPKEIEPVEISKIKEATPPAVVEEPKSAMPAVPEVKAATPEVATVETPEKPVVPEVKPITPPAVITEPEAVTTEAPAIPSVPEVKPVTPPVAVEEPKVAVAEKPAVPEVKPAESPAKESAKEKEPEIAEIEDMDIPSAPALKSISAPTEAATEAPATPAEGPATAVKPITVPGEEAPAAVTEGPNIAAIPTPEKPVTENHKPRAITAVEVPTADSPVKATASSVETGYETEWD